MFVTLKKACGNLGIAHSRDASKKKICHRYWLKKLNKCVCVRAYYKLEIISPPSNLPCTLCIIFIKYSQTSTWNAHATNYNDYRQSHDFRACIIFIRLQKNFMVVVAQNLSDGVLYRTLNENRSIFQVPLTLPPSQTNRI